MPSTSVFRGGLPQTARSVNVAGAANVTLSGDQLANSVLILTGALTGNITVTFPVSVEDAGLVWSVDNRTTGAFTVTLAGPSGTTITSVQGRRTRAEWDGVNMVHALTEGQRCRLSSIVLAAATDVVLVEGQYTASFISVTGTSGGSTNLVLPQVEGGPWIVQNASGSNVVMKMATGAAVTIATAKYAMLWSNGTDVLRLTADT